MSKQILNLKQTTPETFFVTSGTDERVGYTVNIKEGTCDCPVNFHKGEYCKHMNTVDEYLMIQDKIPTDECEKCEPEDYNGNCQYQQVMFDRGYILFVIKDKHTWKKKEAWEKMAEDKQGVIELGEVDRHPMVHGNCSHFHLFDQSEKLKGDRVVRFSAKGISQKLANEVYEDLEKIMEKYTGRHIDVCDRFEVSDANTETDEVVPK